MFDNKHLRNTKIELLVNTLPNLVKLCVLEHKININILGNLKLRCNF